MMSMFDTSAFDTTNRTMDVGSDPESMRLGGQFGSIVGIRSQENDQTQQDLNNVANYNSNPIVFYTFTGFVAIVIAIFAFTL